MPATDDSAAARKETLDRILELFRLVAVVDAAQLPAIDAAVLPALTAAKPPPVPAPDLGNLPSAWPPKGFDEEAELKGQIERLAKGQKLLQEASDALQKEIAYCQEGIEARVAFLNFINS